MLKERRGEPGSDEKRWIDVVLELILMEGISRAESHYIRAGLLAVGIEGEGRPLNYNSTSDLSFLRYFLVHVNCSY